MTTGNAPAPAALAWFVPGHPAPQGSKRYVGHGRMIESSKKLAPWRERIALTAHNEMRGRPLLAGPTTITLEFILTRPKSTPKRRTPPATRQPDIDKLARAVLDALTGTTLIDDAQVTELTARKRLAELGETPGVNIAVANHP